MRIPDTMATGKVAINIGQYRNEPMPLGLGNHYTLRHIMCLAQVEIRAKLIISTDRR